MGKYIIWTYYGYEGWSPTYYETQEEVINAMMSDMGGNRVITKIIELTIKDEKDESERHAEHQGGVKWKHSR